MKKICALALAGSFALFATRSGATTITEDFSTDPVPRGWKVFGDTRLFQWDSTGQTLAVTWDSSQTNSYFYHPLGTILTTNDDFSLEFDVQLNDVVVGGFGFPIAIGFLRFADATRTNFFRGTGFDSPNLVEFNYFPDVGFGPSLTVTMTDTNSTFDFVYDTVPLEPGVLYHVVLAQAAGAPMLRAEVFMNGQLYTALPDSFSTNFTDFRVDAISISSYHDPGSGGSILAHGVVDNLIVTTPPPPVQNLSGAWSNNIWQARCISRSNWLYTLQRTADFQSWTDVSTATTGNATNLLLPDANPPAGTAFYRMKAERP